MKIIQLPGFSRAERRAVIMLSVCLLCYAGAGVLMSHRIDRESEANIEEIKMLLMVRESRSVLMRTDLEEAVDTGMVPGMVTKENVSREGAKYDHSVPADLNRIDAGEIAARTGIHLELAARIVKFRDRLGGFHSLEQIKEVYGLTEEGASRFLSGKLIVSGEVVRLNINTSSVDELKAHPYISDGLATQMVNFREKVKKYEQLEDVMQLYFVDDELYAKIAPYLSVE